MTDNNSTFLLYLFIGYGVVWLGIFGYFLYLGARLRAVQRDLKSLREGDSSKSDGAGDP